MAYRTIPAVFLLLAMAHIFPTVHGAYVKIVPGTLMKWVTISDPGGEFWGVNSQNIVSRLENGKWVPKVGRLVQISAGFSGVWGVNQNDEVFLWKESAASWEKIPGFLTRVSSGFYVYGVNRAGTIFRYISEGTWKIIPGLLKEISSGDDQDTWGINSQNQVFRLTVRDEWQLMPGLLTKISVGKSGVWGVNSADEVFTWTGTYWQKADGLLRQIDSGWAVIGVTGNGEVFQRV